MELSIIALVVSCAANLVIGGVVLARNPRKKISIIFASLTLFSALWSASNYLVEYDFADLEVNRLLNIGAYFFAMMAVIFIAIFSFSFQQTLKSRRLFRYLLFSFIFSAGLSLTPAVHGSVKLVNGELQFESGQLTGLYLLIILTYLYLSVRHLSRVAKTSSTQVSKQARTILWGLAVSVSLIAIVNGIIPLITGNFSSTKLGPLCTVFMIYAFGYSIVKHKLFDIKLVVARTIGYVLSIGTIIAAVMAIVVTQAQLISGSDQVELRKEILPLFFAVLMGISFPSIKRFFDRLTNRIFYRDAYDPQLFLDELNKTIVGNIETGILLRHTANVIEDNLKAACHIFVKETEVTSARILGTSRKEIDDASLEVIKAELATIKDKTVLADNLEEHYENLKQELDANDIAVVSSMITSYSSNQEATAYLFLGPKKSGNTYSRADLRIISIITDELLIAIQNALRFEEIQSFNVTLQKSVGEATSKIKRSNDKLREMDETKDEFISMASHQLRTPLTSVKGYLSMVLDGDAGKLTNTQKQLLNQAYVSSQRMVYLIADLLNVSRLKTGKFIIDAAPANLVEMVESEIAQLTEVAKSRKLSLSFEKPTDFPTLMLDETKTRQVIMNFVDNAIYYTPSGGKIKIELSTDRGSVYFMVKDNGLGVPKEDQAHLFTKFYRAKNAQKARPDGTGLGLFMAKKVITEQGGTILFESTEDKGSTFGFKFDKPKASK
jgi:signal transduction histidine kinase